MKNILEKINDAVSFIRTKTELKPSVGIILGSGLGKLGNQLTEMISISYSEIPHFPSTTVAGHIGKLLLGNLNGKVVVCMQGRFHFYEGYSMEEVAFPVRVMKSLGVETIIISNASGGLNPEIKIGDICIITDHISLLPDHPLRGKNEDSLGTRFPDMHSVYDKELISRAMAVARSHAIRCHTGVYVGVQGPTFETPAEYKFMRIIGGDCVGMSTVPEVIVAQHMGIKIFCISVIADEGNPPEPVRISHQEVVAAAESAEPKLTLIVTELLKTL